MSSAGGNEARARSARRSAGGSDVAARTMATAAACESAKETAIARSARPLPAALKLGRLFLHVYHVMNTP